MILHEIFRVGSRFPHYISCCIAESRFPLGPMAGSQSWRVEKNLGNPLSVAIVLGCGASHSNTKAEHWGVKNRKFRKGVLWMYDTF